MDSSTELKPLGRYLRQLDGADFSLQANTEAAARPDHFYLFRGDEVLLETDDFGRAYSEYKRMCAEWWERQIKSSNHALRVASAWGLLAQDPFHRRATAVIQAEGGPADQKR